MTNKRLAAANQRSQASRKTGETVTPRKGREGEGDFLEGDLPAEFSALRHVGTGLRETYRSFARELTQNLASLDLNLHKWFLMRALWIQDGPSQSALAQRLELSPAAIVKLVNALEQANLVERRPGKKDNRVFNIHLTARGRALQKRAARLALRTDERALAGFSSVEIDMLLTLLARLRANLPDASASGLPERTIAPGLASSGEKEFSYR